MESGAGDAGAGTSKGTRAGKGKGKGNAGRGKKGSGERTGGQKRRVSRSVKAGLIFPVGRMGRYLKKGRYAERVGSTAPVYLAAVVEYVASELLEIAGDVARQRQKKRIIPRHIQVAVKTDKEFSVVFKDVTIAEGGVLYGIHPALETCPEMEKRRKKEFPRKRGRPKREKKISTISSVMATMVPRPPPPSPPEQP